LKSCELRVERSKEVLTLNSQRATQVVATHLGWVVKAVYYSPLAIRYSLPFYQSLIASRYSLPFRQSLALPFKFHLCRCLWVMRLVSSPKYRLKISLNFNRALSNLTLTFPSLIPKTSATSFVDSPSTSLSKKTAR